MEYLLIGLFIGGIFGFALASVMRRGGWADGWSEGYQAGYEEGFEDRALAGRSGLDHADDNFALPRPQGRRVASLIGGDL